MSLGARRRRPPTPGYVANDLWRRAGAVPSFHINPAALGHARDLITGTVLGGGTVNSATPAWEAGPDGILAQPAANSPVIVYDPATLRPLGLRDWQGVTNRIRNNTGQGAATGTPGTLPTNWSTSGFSGLTREVVAISSVNGIDYIDIRFSGTATGTFGNLALESVSSVAASNAQSWTASAWLQLVAGSFSGVGTRVFAAQQHNAANLYLSDATAGAMSAAIDATLTRINRSFTTNQATIASITPYLQFGFTNGAAIDFTLRIGLPQLEQSAVMGPIVKTTGTAASSTAEATDITSLPGGINNIHTVYARVRTPASGIRGIISLNDNSSSNRLELLTNGTDPRAVAVTSGSTVADINGGTIAANTTFRIAARFDGDNYAVSINGAPVATDNAGARAIVDRIFLGRTQAGEYLNGIIEELATWTQPLGNSQLQAVAA